MSNKEKILYDESKISKQADIQSAACDSTIKNNACVESITPINSLEKMYTEYENEQNKINIKYQVKELEIRIIFNLFPLILSIPLHKFLGFLTFILWGISTISTSIILHCLRLNIKCKTEINDLRIEFLLKYKCPNCKARIGEIHWRLLKDQKKCTVCKEEIFEQ